MQHREGLIEDEVWAAYRNALVGNLDQPGFRLRWQSMSYRYPKSFLQAISPAQAY